MNTKGSGTGRICTPRNYQETATRVQYQETAKKLPRNHNSSRLHLEIPDWNVKTDKDR